MRRVARVVVAGVVSVALAAATSVAAVQASGDQVKIEGTRTVTLKPRAGAPSEAGRLVGVPPAVTGDAAVDTQAKAPRGEARVSAQGRAGRYQARFGAAFQTTVGADENVLGRLEVTIENLEWSGQLRWNGQITDYSIGPGGQVAGCPGCLRGTAAADLTASVVDLDTGELLASQAVLSKSKTFVGPTASAEEVLGRDNVRIPSFQVAPGRRLAVYITLTVSASSGLYPAATTGAATADFMRATTQSGAGKGTPSTQPPNSKGKGTGKSSIARGISYQEIKVRLVDTAVITKSLCRATERTPQTPAETTIVDYFRAIQADDYATAYSLLDAGLQAGWGAAGPTSVGADNFESFMAEHVACVKVTEIVIANAPNDLQVSASLGIQWYKVTLDARYRVPFPGGSGEFQRFYKVRSDPHTGAGRPPDRIIDIATGLGGETTTTTSPSTTTTTRGSSTTSSSSTTTSSSTTSSSTTTTTRPLTGPATVVSLGDSFISGEAGRWEGNALNPLFSRAGTDRAFAWKTETHVKQVTEAVESWGILGWFTQWVTKLVNYVVEVPTWDPSLVYPGSAANLCHRSDTAEVNAQIPGIVNHFNLACSGAVAANVYRGAGGGESFKGERPQADQLVDVALHNNVKLIVLSIGGNDLQFSDIVTDCVYAYGLSPAWAQTHCQDSWTTFANDKLSLISPAEETVANRVRKAIDEIRAAMEHRPVNPGSCGPVQCVTGAGYAPSQYRIVIQSYPSPIPRGSEFAYPESLPAPMTAPLGIVGVELSNGRAALGCPFWDSDATWARDTLVPSLSNTLAAVATEKQVGFIDLRDFLQNREICSIHDTSELFVGPPSASDAEWARAIFFLAQANAAQGDAQEAIHPNAYAQRGLQRCLSSAYDYVWNQNLPTVHLKCVNGPGGPENVTTQVVP